MKTDEPNGVVPEATSAGDRQNRREFLNGLGKWSMIVVAAVSSLRGSVDPGYAGRDETPRPEWGLPETSFQKVAKKKHRQHVDVGSGHTNFPHGDVPHVDQRIQKGGGIQQSPSGVPLKKSE